METKCATFRGFNAPSRSWDEFSNHTTQSLRKMDYYNAGSLESVHDSVHDVLVGEMAYAIIWFIGLIFLCPGRAASGIWYVLVVTSEDIP